MSEKKTLAEAVVERALVDACARAGAEAVEWVLVSRAAEIGAHAGHVLSHERLDPGALVSSDPSAVADAAADRALATLVPTIRRVLKIAVVRAMRSSVD